MVGEPFAVSGRPTREAIDTLTAELWTRLHDLVRDAPPVAPPGRIGRWLTEQFNEWPRAPARRPQAGLHARSGGRSPTAA